jgi:SAM-dependent methyltransferase
LAARLFIRQFATTEPVAVLEVGSRDVNGGIRDLFRNAAYTGVDITEGDGVDIVADAASWEPDRQYDIVICAEVLEHAPAWRDIVKTCWRALRPGGLFVMTAAGPGRKPHSAYCDEEPGDEWYENIDPAHLEDATTMFYDANIDVAGEDIRMWCLK